MRIAYAGAMLVLLVGCSSGPGAAPTGAAGAGGHAGSGGAAGSASDAAAGGAGGAAGGAGGAAGGASDAAAAGAGGASGAGGVDAAADVADALGLADVGGADAVCGETTLSLQGARPDLLLLLDKSGSMANDFFDMTCPAGCTSKWTALKQALSTVVTATQARVNWGLKTFANNNMCAVNGGVILEVGPDNATVLLNALAQLAPGGSTPTAVAEQSATAYLASVVDANPRYILLATDGEPNCAVAGMNIADDARAIQAVSDALTAGFQTFVLGIGNVATAMSTLNMMATAGGEAQPADATGRIYFPADSASLLVQALTTITGAITSCTFALPAAPPAHDGVTVLGDGTAIPSDPTNGWSYGSNGTTVILNGTACNAFRTGAIQSVTADYTCAGSAD